MSDDEIDALLADVRGLCAAGDFRAVGTRIRAVLHALQTMETDAIVAWLVACLPGRGEYADEYRELSERAWFVLEEREGYVVAYGLHRGFDCGACPFGRIVMSVASPKSPVNAMHSSWPIGTWRELAPRLRDAAWALAKARGVRVPWWAT